MLVRLIEDLNPTHIAVCFDRTEPTFRNKLLPTYQSQRPETVKELASQFSKARDFVNSAGIPVYEKIGFEADDLIGTIAYKAKSKVDEVVIVTGDRDQLQLVGANVKVYMPIVGLAAAKLMGEGEVVEKMGVVPSQIVDYKALVGDASDNYFGVVGVGPKTAITLLNSYQSFPNIYAHLDKISPKVREKLEKSKSQAELSYKLAKIVCDVPIDFKLDLAKGWQINNLKVLKLFESYGFRTLTERVKKLGHKLDAEKQGILF